MVVVDLAVVLAVVVVVDLVVVLTVVVVVDLVVVLAVVVVLVTFVVILAEVDITLSSRDFLQGLFLITTPPAEALGASSMSSFDMVVSVVS